MNHQYALPARALIALVGLSLFVGACNFPAGPSTQDLLATAAAQTVSAQLTQAFAVSPTLPVLPATETPLPPTLQPQKRSRC